MKEGPKPTKGIFEMIKEAPVTEWKMPTEKDWRNLWKKMEKERIQHNKKMKKLNREHSEHFAKRQKELGEEAPPEIVLLTSPMLYGGIPILPMSIIKKYKKWL